jgi:hypothetical protein
MDVVGAGKPGPEPGPGFLISDMPPDPFDEDRELRRHLAALGPAALRELQDVLTWPHERRDALLRSWVCRPDLADLAQLIAMANTDEVIRLRLLRGIRDVDASRDPIGVTEDPAKGGQRLEGPRWLQIWPSFHRRPHRPVA